VTRPCEARGLARLTFIGNGRRFSPFEIHNTKELFPQAPRGLSGEEKRVKLLEIFHESVS
jgi:hypothetical protein